MIEPTHKKFTIKLKVIQTYELTIEAPDQANAEEVAIEEYNNGNMRKDDPINEDVSVESCIQDS
jgi:hypothetical protein|tara:strand:- start:1564 stop:1755 length:192 start_codon:yes stop_codon:yes gene_type:complete